MSKQSLHPQMVLLPISWKAQGTRTYTRILSEESRYVLGESVSRFDDIHPVADDGHNKINTLRSCSWLGNERTAWATRHQRPYSQRAIPQPGMVSTNISNINKCMEPRNKNGVTDSESSCHFTFGKSRLQIFIKNRHCTKRSDFECHPTGWERIIIFSFESTYKLFIAALELIVDTYQGLGMLGQITKKRGIGKPIAIVSHRQHVGHLGTDSYLYTLYAR